MMPHWIVIPGEVSVDGGSTDAKELRYNINTIEALWLSLSDILQSLSKSIAFHQIPHPKRNFPRAIAESETEPKQMMVSRLES